MCPLPPLPVRRGFGPLFPYDVRALADGARVTHVVSACDPRTGAVYLVGIATDAIEAVTLEEAFPAHTAPLAQAVGRLA